MSDTDTKIKVLENAGSLSESDLELIAGTDLIEMMMRNRIMMLANPKEECDWLTLTEGFTGLYHIRSIDGARLFQLWFEHAYDIETFKKNLFVAKIGNIAYTSTTAEE